MSSREEADGVSWESSKYRESIHDKVKIKNLDVSSKSNEKAASCKVETSIKAGKKTTDNTRFVSKNNIDMQCFQIVDQSTSTKDDDLLPELGIRHHSSSHAAQPSCCWRLLMEFRCRKEWCWTFFVFAVCGAVLYIFVSFLDGKTKKPTWLNYH